MRYANKSRKSVWARILPIRATYVPPPRKSHLRFEIARQGVPDDQPLTTGDNTSRLALCETIPSQQRGLRRKDERKFALPTCRISSLLTFPPPDSPMSTVSFLGAT